MPRHNALRVEFSKEHDAYLYKYLARYCPSKEGRSGQKIFQRLVANEDEIWPWSVHHTWQSWRERYVKNADHFDKVILNYQRKHNIKSPAKSKRAAEPTPMDVLGPSAKRARHQVEKSSSETRIEKRTATSSSPSRSQLISDVPRTPQATHSNGRSMGATQPTDARPSSSSRSNGDMNTDKVKKPSLDLPDSHARNNMHATPSSTPNQPPPPMNGKTAPHSPPRPVKRKARSRTPSEVFASEPPSPRGNVAVLAAGRAPDNVYPRAPPRVVDSLHGHVLVDQKGHVPRAFPHAQANDAGEEEEDEAGKVPWPPLRGRTAKSAKASAPDVKVDAHYAFSQPQPQPQPGAPLESAPTGERGRGNVRHPFQRRPLVAQAEGGLHEDTTQSGASPVKRIVPTMPSPATPPGLIPKPATKAFKFPVPRASTRSPFRPEPPTRKARHPAPHALSCTQVARHPALSRIRRQTIGLGHEHENERGRERQEVPSVDLVALSCSSSSTHSMVPAKPSRWSLPAYMRPIPRSTDEPESSPSIPGPRSGSGSPFRLFASSHVYADVWRHARTSSGETSTGPLFTPSPPRSIAAVATNARADINVSTPGSRSGTIPGSPALSVEVAPHPADVALAMSHGLASILAYMSANHGLALGVVEAVYKRVGSLREADEVLRGMREAAEEFGERAIEKRGRDRRGSRTEGARRERRGKGTVLRYVMTSEDGEGSEYSPPETSKAAMWKQRSESASHAEEAQLGIEGEEQDEDENEGRAVEEELWEGDEGEREAEVEVEVEVTTGIEDGPADRHNNFSRAVLDNMEAQELEKKMGRRQFHKETAKRFVK